jgi:predicted PurR-regulated permease PerM
MNIELSQVVLNNGLAFLAVVTAIVVAFVGYFVVKLLKDLSVLAKNVSETSSMLNAELAPTLQELNETIHSINSIIKSTDEGVGSVKSGIESAISKTKAFSESVLGGFLKGFMTVFSLMKRK